jgi:outer membrane protein OmpA-like peptidoglycan-associated protein
MKKLFCIVFLYSAYALSAQKKDTLRVYYAINSAKPDVMKLDSFLTSLHGTLTEVRISGYADFLSTNPHNLNLSLRRANNVKKYLLQKAKFIEILECSGKGELAGNEHAPEKGVPQHRRVDIIYNAKVFVENMENFPTVTEPKKKINDSVEADKRTIADLNVGESMSIEGLSFIPGEHYLLRESAVPLRKLLETLLKNPNIKIEIQGHVCCTKNKEDGLDLSTGEKKLSENRAKFIYDYLVGKGISANRLRYKGYGRTMPKAPEERNEAEEQMNRRVEIKILEK